MFEQLDADTQERLAGVLETRAADPRQQALRRTFLEGVTFPRSARVLEVGCGTGALTRILAGWAGIDSVVGLDPASALLERARALAGGLGNVTFTEGDARFGSRPRSSTPSCSTRCCPTCRSPSRRSQRRLAGREETAAALKAEARRRVAADTWFAYVSYASVVARKPG